MLVIALLFGLLAGLNCQQVINVNIKNKNVERVIDLSTQLVKITSTITLENAGKEAVSDVHLLLEPNFVGNLAYKTVKDGLKDDLVVKSVKIGKLDGFNVALNQPIAAGKTATIVVEYVFTNALIPYPSSITQKDKQLVRYFGNHYLYTPYFTNKQTTIVTLNTRNVENYSKLKPVTQSDSTISYGPYNDIAANTLDDMTIHYENNAPFLKVTRLERLIEVSHWGNIAVQEDIEILHTGAKLQGPFSRYDYQRDTSSTHHSIKSYRTVLPAAAHSIYYRDSNGNISTSQVKQRKDWIELELRPRFPLFGGWKSSYTLGYSIPSYQNLYRLQKDKFMLRMRFLDHVFDDMQVDELETSIVLPVGVTNIELVYPYEIERLPDLITHKYLDHMGRPVIRLRKSNLVEQHIQDVDLIYEWKSAMLTHEPLLITCTLLVLFLLVIIYVRLDFSIHKSDHNKKE